ncbi:MAG: hypoxanthine phosphoribosyltransferase [Bacteroidales bacterium]|nr:hypoxanthine phosphoribosyltransferase [Bacteroidales bacterium]
MEKIITLKDKKFRPYIPYAEVEAAIDAVARKVNDDFRDSEDIPVVLCVLNGAIIFTAELLKRLEFNCELMSVKLSSYQGTESTGTVLNIMGITGDVRGRRVIITEDIVDTGNTIVALKEMLLDKGAKDVKICTMLLKPDVYKKDTVLDYVGKEIANEFIVGLGLDYDELGRNLKDIYKITD